MSGARPDDVWRESDVVGDAVRSLFGGKVSKFDLSGSSQSAGDLVLEPTLGGGVPVLDKAGHLGVVDDGLSLLL